MAWASRGAAAGRPGWHIECSAMSKEHLGETIDLHTGGVDLLFPHHENEIAQSQCCNGTTFARHWYHSEHLLVDGKKMSKIAGQSLHARRPRREGFLADGACATPCSWATRASSSISRSIRCTRRKSALSNYSNRAGLAITFEAVLDGEQAPASDNFNEVLAALT